MHYFTKFLNCSLFLSLAFNASYKGCTTKNNHASLPILEESFLCDNENLLSMDWIYFRNELFFEVVFLLVTKTNSQFFSDTFVVFE